MKHIKRFNEDLLNIDIVLTEDEKMYLFSKLEYNKKKRIINDKNDIYIILNNKGTSAINEDIFIRILNSLDYNIRLQLMDPSKEFRNPIAQSIKSKLPQSWIGIKYSNIKSKNRNAGNA